MSLSLGSFGRPMDLLAFYRQHDPKPDYRGRQLETILNWDDNKLEQSHDYIQILFPLPEPSGVNWNAPIITEEVYNAFRDNKGNSPLQRNFQRAFVRIMAFYGFNVDESKLSFPEAVKVPTKSITVWSENHNKCFSNWVSGGHNSLRITRIIRSLRVLGRSDLADIMMQAIISVWESPEYSALCDSQSMHWWSKAYKWPLYSLPAGIEGAVGQDLQWLKKKVDAEECSG